jgi:hypothetical protein
MPDTRLSFCHECGSPVGHAHACPLSVYEPVAEPETESAATAIQWDSSPSRTPSFGSGSVDVEYRRLIECAERLLANHAEEVASGRAAAAAEAKAASTALLIENAGLKAALAVSEQSLYELRLSIAALTRSTPTLGSITS